MYKYRPDIDGLRFIAAALVLLYHFQFSIISGGYVGVDVFFVITGFVMSNLLMKQLSAGTFLFSDFYSKRIKRLIPALLLMSFVVFLLISPIYMDEEYYIFSKSWLYSLIGYSNFYFIDEFAKYFSADAATQPLLHTWTLAVEFQFYFLWPPVLVLVYRYLNRSAAPWVFLALWLATFGYSIYRTDAAPDSAYFLLTTRLFELLLGAGLALFGNRLPRLNDLTSNALSLAGLALIIGSAFVLTKDSLFPGYNALWPVLGTGLVIYAGLNNSNALAGRLLGSTPLVYLGALSYSLYLWHWPLVAILNNQLIPLDLTNQLLLIAASLVLSWFSYTFVESKLRYKDWSLKKSFLLMMLLPAIVIWAVQVTIRVADDISFRIPQKNRELYRVINQQDAGDIFDPCFDGDAVSFDQGEHCLLGAKEPGKKPDAMLLGDSHATAMAGFVEELSKRQGITTLLVTKASSPFILAEDTVATGDERKVKRNQVLQDYLDHGEPMTIFLSAWWTAYLASDQYQGYFENIVRWLLERGHRVVVIEDAFRLPSNSFAYCLLKNQRDCTVPRADVESEQVNFYRFKETIQARYPQVGWINPRSAMCNEERCDTVLDGIPLYRDDNHLNYAGSKIIGRRFLEQFGNPLSAS
ncbi:acyltransferase family protein [Salinisphaera sp. G21_0]|uniref:acyltransferase family protein n=1 Tax=Salinisphaera sp. G21_0 TaxID=2821094 RepID=UPI001ADB3957|nr:acyltransferase family protein [Salinisphaera sp. G21_0]MBO9481968.1 acyltransferase [Salinisphaera sp. G21_0]